MSYCYLGDSAGCTYVRVLSLPTAVGSALEVVILSFMRISLYSEIGIWLIMEVEQYGSGQMSEVDGLATPK